MSVQEIMIHLYRWSTMYWAIAEAQEQGRDYCDYNYHTPELSPEYRVPMFTRAELEQQAREIGQQNQYLRLTGQLI